MLLERQVGGRRGVLAELLLLARDGEPGRAAPDEVGADPLAVAREDVERVRVRPVGDPLLRAGDAALVVGAGSIADASLPEPDSVSANAHSSWPCAAGGISRSICSGVACARIGSCPADTWHGERHAEAGVAARDLLERQHVGDEVRARAAVLGGDARAEQPELPHLRQDVLRERVLAIPLRRRGATTSSAKRFARSRISRCSSVRSCTAHPHAPRRPALPTAVKAGTPPPP